MSRERVIGISMRCDRLEEYNEVRDSISQEWTKLLLKFNYKFYYIPNCLNNVEEYIKRMGTTDLLLTGGNDIEPRRYGENTKLKSVNVDRDKTEEQIIQCAVKYEIPLIGVCRGMQMINVFFAGRLIELVQPLYNNHIGIHHAITIIEEAYITSIGAKNLLTNSFHKFGIIEDTLASNLRIWAISDDQVVEAIYHKDYNIKGIMWHPEREESLEKTFKILFDLSKEVH